MNKCIKCKKNNCKNNYKFAVCKVTFLDDICAIEKSVKTENEVRKLFKDNNLLYISYNAFNYTTCYRIDLNYGFILIRYKDTLYGGNIQANVIYDNFELWLNNKIIHGKYKYGIEYFDYFRINDCNYVKKYIKLYDKVSRYKCLILKAIHNNNF